MYEPFFLANSLAATPATTNELPSIFMTGRDFFRHR